jgi:hypothetical protein
MQKYKLKVRLFRDGLRVTASPTHALAATWHLPEFLWSSRLPQSGFHQI